MQEQKQMFEEMRGMWEQFKQKNDEAELEVKKFGEASQEYKNTVDKINEEISNIKTMMNRPNLTGEAKVQEEEEMARKEFDAFLRKGFEGAKSINETVNTQGAYLVPAQRVNYIIRNLIEVSPVRQVSDVITTSSDRVEIPGEGSTQFATGWVSEMGARPQTTAGTFRMETIPVNEMYSNVYVTQSLLDDNAYNVVSYMDDRIALEMAQEEGAAFINGDGIGKPEGLLQSASILNTVTTAAATDITGDEFIDLNYSLKTFYRQRATWLMNSETEKVARKAKDGVGNYLWQPGLQGGQPDRLLGRPVLECPDMPNPTAANVAILFGDIQQTYTIVDRQDMRLVRDELTSKPFVEFYYTRRLGGQVTKGESTKKLTMHA